MLSVNIGSRRAFLLFPAPLEWELRRRELTRDGLEVLRWWDLEAGGLRAKGGQMAWSHPSGQGQYFGEAAEGAEPQVSLLPRKHSLWSSKDLWCQSPSGRPRPLWHWVCKGIHEPNFKAFVSFSTVGLCKLPEPLWSLERLATFWTQHPAHTLRRQLFGSSHLHCCLAFFLPVAYKSFQSVSPVHWCSGLITFWGRAWSPAVSEMMVRGCRYVGQSNFRGRSGLERFWLRCWWLGWNQLDKWIRAGWVGPLRQGEMKDYYFNQG